MRFRRSISIPVFAVAAAVCLAGSLFLLRGTSPAAPVLRTGETGGQALPVEARPAHYQGAYRTLETYAGRAVTRRASDLGFENGGLLTRILVDEGDEVREGEPLAGLDRRQLEAQRDEIAARLEMARLTAQRRKSLVERNTVSQQSYDQARLEARATAAALKAVIARLDLAELKAPYDAVVVERLADEGTVVRPGQPVLRVIERNAWEARIGLPPDRAAGLKTGQSFELTVAGGKYTAILRTVLPEVDPATRTTLALFDIPAPDGNLQYGALARIRIETEVRERGFWLPVIALSEGRRGLWTAYVIGGRQDGAAAGALTGPAERRQLQIIHAETDRAYVRGAVKEGEFVVTAGVHRIVPGQTVSRAPLSAGGP